MFSKQKHFKEILICVWSVSVSKVEVDGWWKLMQINQSKEEANITWKLVYWCCLYQELFLRLGWRGKCDFLAVRHVVFDTEHGVMLGKKKGSTSVWLWTTRGSASHSYAMPRPPTRTGPCHEHILPSNGAARCACSRPVCCVCISCTWSIMVPSQRHTASQCQQKQHSPHPYLICLLLFIQQKNKASYST